MLHKKYVNRGFTLVELLAVIVILAIILVIAVPKIMSVITDSKKSSLETSAKMIASSAEKIKVQKELLGEEITGTVDCSEFTKVTSDYESCTVKFDGNTAKVNITGANKFEGLSICNADKNNAEATAEGCPKEQYSIVGKEWPEIITAVKSGDYEFTVGEEHEVDLGDLGIHTLRIANTTPCSDVEVESQTACGFVLEFVDIIVEKEFDTGNGNGAGVSLTYAVSQIRDFLNEELLNYFPIDLANSIIDTKTISGGRFSSDTYKLESENKIYLLSGEEIFKDYYASFDTSIGKSRQLDYYQLNNISMSDSVIKTYQSVASEYWLRSANAQSSGYYVNNVLSSGKGYSSGYYPNTSEGISPAFRLAE